MKSSFVASLLDGDLAAGALSPFPALPHGRAQQMEEVLARIRSVHAQEQDGVATLKEWNLLHDLDDWPALILSRVLREVGAADVSAALSCIAHLALGVRLVRAFGSAQQLFAVHNHPGGAVLAFALTEASPGSDVSQLQTFAKPREDGYVLSGKKHWVTNARAATHFIVMARTVPAHPGTKPRMTAFLVPRGKGIEVTDVRSTVLPGALVGEVTFDEVRLSRSDVLGTPGKGFRVVMHGLSDARLFLASAVLGACVQSFDETIVRLNQRRAFGRRVGHFPSVQDRVAGMLADILALESLVHGTAGSVHSVMGIDPVERAVVRLAASRAATRILDGARELHGAAAFAGDTRAARRWADTRALTLLDGSDLALESFIILEGTRDIRHELEDLSRKPTPVAYLESTWDRASKNFKNRTLRALSSDVPAVRLQHLSEHAEELSQRIRQELKHYGRDIVEMQHVQRRLATVLMELSTWFALAMRVDSEVARHGETGSQRMIEAAAIWISAADSRVRVQFERLDENDDIERDRIASTAYSDQTYPFDIF